MVYWPSDELGSRRLWRVRILLAGGPTREELRIATSPNYTRDFETLRPRVCLATFLCCRVLGSLDNLACGSPPARYRHNGLPEDQALRRAMEYHDTSSRDGCPGDIRSASLAGKGKACVGKKASSCSPRTMGFQTSVEWDSVAASIVPSVVNTISIAPVLHPCARILMEPHVFH